MAAVVADLVPDDATALAEPFELLASMAGAAPAVNPTSSSHRNAVRAAWVFGAFGLIVTAVVILTELVAAIIQELNERFLFG